MLQSRDWQLAVATMDSLSCNVIYVNRLVEKDALIRAVPDSADVVHESSQSGWKHEHDRNLVKPLLDAFGAGMSPSFCVYLMPLFLLDFALQSMSPSMLAIFWAKKRTRRTKGTFVSHP